MSKTVRPARTATTRKRTVAKTAATRKPADRAKTAARKKAASSTSAVKKRATRPAAASTRKARSVAKAPVEKRPPTPRLPADVKAAIAAAQDKLAIDLTVLDLRKVSAFTDFFIVCTGTNVRQVQAIADGVEASLRAAGQKPALVEGYRKGEWVLLDYFDFIVHIFLPARRNFYALERLWGGAEPIEVSAR